MCLFKVERKEMSLNSLSRHINNFPVLQIPFAETERVKWIKGFEVLDGKIKSKIIGNILV